MRNDSGDLRFIRGSDFLVVFIINLNMKILHIADLHIGKSIDAFQMLEDQEYALSQILDYAREHKPDALIIAGDVYDKAAPTPEAVRVFDRFLTSVAELGLTAFIISGNHDSPERLGFGSEIFKSRDIHLYSVFEGKMRVVTLRDEFGEVDFYLLPYIRPYDARHFFDTTATQDMAIHAADTQDTAIHTAATDDAAIRAATTEDAARLIINAARIPPGRLGSPTTRSVLVAHQFVTASGQEPVRSDSEREVIGGTDRIDAFVSGIAELFDYAALGHLHGQQRVGAEHVRYAGSPLKYSVSEHRHNKAALLVELCEKGNLSVRQLPIKALRNLRRIKGTLEELISEDLLRQCDKEGIREDYVYVTLTDQDYIFDAIRKLRVHYPNVLDLKYENRNSEYEQSDEYAGIFGGDNFTGAGFNGAYGANSTDGGADGAYGANGTGGGADVAYGAYGTDGGAYGAEGFDAIINKNTSPLSLFMDFFQIQNGHAPDNAQIEFIRKFIQSGE